MPAATKPRTTKASSSRKAPPPRAVAGITYDLIEVTPGMADAWLKNNTNNRKLRPRKVIQYARDMAAGLWVENGQSVAFDRNAALLDGQHRLEAVKRSGVTVTMLIARGLEPEVQKTIDTGMARTFADTLRFSGESDVAVAGAVVRRMFLWKHGFKTSGAGGSTLSVSHSELMDFYEENRSEIRVSVSRGNDVRRHTGLLTTSTAAMAFYLFAKLDYDDAQRFFDALISGENISRGHPVWALRNRLIRAQRVDRLTEVERLALVIYAWNYMRDDEPVDRLLLPSGAKKLSNETFPEPT